MDYSPIQIHTSAPYKQQVHKYRVAAIFPEHFQSFTVALKNQNFYQLFHGKLSQLYVEAETITKRHIPAKINQQEATKAATVSMLCAEGIL
jgi:hypothetical protein